MRCGILQTVNAADSARISGGRRAVAANLENRGDRFLKVRGERRNQLGLLLFDFVGIYNRALERCREVLLDVGDIVEMTNDDWFDHSCEGPCTIRAIFELRACRHNAPPLEYRSDPN